MTERYEELILEVEELEERTAPQLIWGDDDLLPPPPPPPPPTPPVP